MKQINFKAFLILLLTSIGIQVYAQNPVKGNDTTVPLHALPPEYKIPYGTTKPDDVKKVLDRVFTYLDTTTPAELVNSKTNAVIQDFKKPDKDAILKPGDFRLTSYEWGVTYGAMLLTGEITGDKRYTDYTVNRFKFLAEVTPYFQAFA